MSTQLNSPAAPLTGARQTMMSWARVIRSHAEVPEIYQDACRALFGGRPVFPYVVLAPVMSGPRHRESEKLLCELDDTLYVMERAGQPPDHNRLSMAVRPRHRIRKHPLVLVDHPQRHNDRGCGGRFDHCVQPRYRALLCALHHQNAAGAHFGWRGGVGGGTG